MATPKLFRNTNQRRAATQLFNIEYTRAIQEHEFLTTLKSDIARLEKLSSYLNETAQLANRVSPQNSSYGTLLNAALQINKWVDHYNEVLKKSAKNRATLAARAVTDLGQHLGWKITKQQTRVMSSGAVLTKDGKEIVVKVKFPTIYQFTTEIKVPGSTVKHTGNYNSADESAFLADVQDFIRQLIRLR